ncbi:MAG: PDZ domain-containing protein [Fimbriimonadales bacterium]|nr:PDZ domain-containing protein [Fimbriimonadales bacterium]
MKILRSLCVIALLSALGSVAFLHGVGRRLEVDRAALLASSPLAGTLLASRQPAQIDETAYFESMSSLVRDTYVEPNVEQSKLALGAVRGMVLGLRDVDCRFMDPRQYQIFRNAQAGNYEGIGIEVALERPANAQEAELPTEGENEGMRPSALTTAVVSRVVPGSSAEQAGMRPGDVLDSLDGKWVVSAQAVLDLQTLQKQVLEGKATARDLNLKREELRKRLQNAMMPARAAERAMSGTEGEVEVAWLRGGQRFSAKLRRGPWRMPIVSERPGGALVVRLVPGAAEELGKRIAGKTAVTLDLRGEASGDFEAMRAVLAKLAPKGQYGRLVRFNPERKTAPLSIETGNPKPPKVTLLVDRFTSGAAEILATALASKGAKLQGTKMSGDRRKIEVVPLPDGGAFTLVTAQFETGGGVQ